MKKRSPKKAFFFCSTHTSRAAQNAMCACIGLAAETTRPCSSTTACLPLITFGQLERETPNVSREKLSLPTCVHIAREGGLLWQILNQASGGMAI